MQTAGIVGGIAPESTVDYYRSIVARWRERTADGSYPSILIDSIDLQRLLRLVASDLGALTDWLVAELERLARAGASFGALASNTPHVVFDELRRRSPIPLVSIVEATYAAVKAANLRRVGLLGTRFTMEGRFYPDVFSKAGVAVVTPPPDERALVHTRYMDELVKGLFRAETRAELSGVVARLRERDGVEAVILAGTELPLLLRGADTAVPLLDTTRIHVDAIVERMLSVEAPPAERAALHPLGDAARLGVQHLPVLPRRPRGDPGADRAPLVRVAPVDAQVPVGPLRGSLRAPLAGAAAELGHPHPARPRGHVRRPRRFRLAAPRREVGG
jgi:aspartate racemase